MCRRRCVYYFVRLNVDCTFYSFNYRIIISVKALEGHKETVLDNILCRIRIGFNIGRSTADNFGNILYLCQQKESTEVLHLTAVLEEYTDGHASLNVASCFAAGALSAGALSEGAAPLSIAFNLSVASSSFLNVSEKSVGV